MRPNDKAPQSSLSNSSEASKEACKLSCGRQSHGPTEKRLTWASRPPLRVTPAPRPQWRRCWWLGKDKNRQSGAETAEQVSVCPRRTWFRQDSSAEGALLWASAWELLTTPTAWPRWINECHISALLFVPRKGNQDLSDGFSAWSSQRNPFTQTALISCSVKSLVDGLRQEWGHTGLQFKLCFRFEALCAEKWSEKRFWC